MTDPNLTDPNAFPPSDSPAPPIPSLADTPALGAPSLVDGHQRVGELLAVLCESAPSAPEQERRHAERRKSEVRFESELAVVRLGIATSLFYAMRTKHGPTAAHCLRVAMTCSSWAERLGIDQGSRDRIEVAALLHDLGKIGVPDRILRKPGKLSVDEQLTMDCCPELACEILRGCTSDQELLDIVHFSNTWYDSRRHGEGPRGQGLPIGARMLAIANAFDAMTIDSVYRRAMSRERAIQEMNEGAGTQFDPELVADFSRMLEQNPEMLQGVTVDRWLRKLQPSSDQALWNSQPEAAAPRRSEIVRRETLFFQRLIDHMNDGVVFTDTEGTITQWNDVMHELTGIASEAIVGQTWSNECIRLRDRDSTRPDICMVTESLRTGARVARPMLIEQPGDDPTPVHVQASPVVGDTPGTHGTVVIVRDLSDQANLEEQLESLYYQTTLDPLTGIANRSHFDDTLRDLTADVAIGGNSFSLIICDVDHFKKVNDVHGHPAGDEALISFASILSGHSRDGDLVARYGGEEFLLLAVNCDIATATHRAEAIRNMLERTPLPSLGNESVTASFGVTEYQLGDSPESLVSRADRALLKAKDNGRNRVVQLGSGQKRDSANEPAKRSWLGWFEVEAGDVASEFQIRTPVPVDIVIEKLRGFIADHNAEVINVSENQLSVKVNAVCSQGGRRRVDKHIAFRVKFTLEETEKVDAGFGVGSAHINTNAFVHIEPIRNRDRRSSELAVCIEQIVASVKSYLMGEVIQQS